MERQPKIVSGGIEVAVGDKEAANYERVAFAYFRDQPIAGRLLPAYSRVYVETIPVVDLRATGKASLGKNLRFLDYVLNILTISDAYLVNAKLGHDIGKHKIQGDLYKRKGRG